MSDGRLKSYAIFRLELHLSALLKLRVIVQSPTGSLDGRTASTPFNKSSISEHVGIPAFTRIRPKPDRILVGGFVAYRNTALRMQGTQDSFVIGAIL